ncbi:hypothetical protein ES705_28920 [subsurface metagenome]
MPLKLYTLRGKHSGRLYYSTGANFWQACRELQISSKDLILERSEVLPVQTTLGQQLKIISSNTAP